MEIKFMFESNQVRYLDHATLAFKLNGITKKTNQTKRLQPIITNKKTSYY